MITRLADVLVIQAIRSWIDTAPAARTGWLGALQDKEIAFKRVIGTAPGALKRRDELRSLIPV